MKITTKQITVTAVMIALCIVVQLFKNPSIPYLTWITGGLINLFIIIATLYSGWVSGLLVSILTPITAFIVTGSPIMATVPLIIPCIMVGNFVMALFAYFVRSKRLELNLLPISLVAGAFAKYGIMTLLIVKWVLPSYGASLSNQMATMATTTYSITQLYAGLVGVFMACIIWPLLKLSVKRGR